MDDPGHPSLRTKGGYWRPPRHRRKQFFTPRERACAVALVIVFVVLAVLSITGHIG